MKRILVTVCAMIALVGCKKDDNDVALDFTLSAQNVYIGQELQIVPGASSGASYTISYGDGNYGTTSGTTQHSYAKGGIFTITMTRGSSNFSKKVRVYPGTASYQIQNNYKKSFFELISQVNDKNSNAIQDAKIHGQLDNGRLSDTVFVNAASLTYEPTVVALFKWRNDNAILINFFIDSYFKASKFQHKIFTLDQNTPGIYSYTKGINQYLFNGSLNDADKQP